MMRRGTPRLPRENTWWCGRSRRTASGRRLRIFLIQTSEAWFRRQITSPAERAAPHQIRLALNGDDEGAVDCDVGVGHAGGVEGEARVAVAVEENQAGGGVRFFGEEGQGFGGGFLGVVMAEVVGGGFGQDDLHDGFAIPGGGDTAGFRVGVAAAADERGIADAAGEFAAGASGGGGGEERAVAVDGHGANGALLVAAVM